MSKQLIALFTLYCHFSTNDTAKSNCRDSKRRFSCKRDPLFARR